MILSIPIHSDLPCLERICKSQRFQSKSVDVKFFRSWLLMSEKSFPGSWVQLVKAGPRFTARHRCCKSRCFQVLQYLLSIFSASSHCRRCGGPDHGRPNASHLEIRESSASCQAVTWQPHDMAAPSTAQRHRCNINGCRSERSWPDEALAALFECLNILASSTFLNLSFGIFSPDVSLGSREYCTAQFRTLTIN